MEIFSSIGLGGMLGLLVGLAFATWIGPNTTAGFSLLVVVGVAIGIVVAALISWIKSFWEDTSE